MPVCLGNVRTVYIVRTEEQRFSGVLFCLFVFGLWFWFFGGFSFCFYFCFLVSWGFFFFFFTLLLSFPSFFFTLKYFLLI